MSKRLLGLTPVLVAFVLVTTSCGTNTETPQASGDIVTIEMRDSVFEPRKLEVDAGDEVTFRFVNRGSLTHDAFIGDEEEQDDHEQEMRSSNEDEHSEHGGAAGITVDPGKSGTLTHRFDEEGEVLIGCHQPGHYAGGMVVKVTVN